MEGEAYGFAAFRSRQQTHALESALKGRGIFCKIINTPHEIGMGCGLSVRFRLEDLRRVQAVSDTMGHSALIGLYSAAYENGRLVCKPLVRMMRNCN